MIQHPLSQADVQTRATTPQLENAVRSFARKNGFAIREALGAPRGRLEFETRLYRDDIFISVSKLTGDPVGLAAYPLCSCGGIQHGILQRSAQNAIDDLGANLRSIPGS